MSHMDIQKNTPLTKNLLIAAGILCIGAVGYLTNMVITLKNDLAETTYNLSMATSEKELLRASSTKALTQANETIEAISSELSLTSEELDDLEDDYRKEKKKNDTFEDQIKEITGTVGDLDKLSKTDKELLQKYSKVSFLNEHYIPEKLEEIDPEWKYSEDKENKLHSNVMPYFEDMLEDALDDDIKIWVVSAYRSFEHQAHLKGQYTVIYGSGANAFSADQGFSEHQLGTTVDFTTEGIGGGLDGFQNTEAYTWLTKNAHKYGFVLSYPEKNGYYIFEPWHWRFVGEDLADELHDDDAYFYDWEQREIDQYLIKIFD